jgi:hypothetical protein
MEEEDENLQHGEHMVYILILMAGGSGCQRIDYPHNRNVFFSKGVFRLAPRSLKNATQRARFPCAGIEPYSHHTARESLRESRRNDCAGR